MAYVNVAEWKTDQVCEWLKGLDTSVLPYVHSFTNHAVSGQQLLSLRPEDLEHLGVLKLGHQEIILEAVEYLRNFHYELDRENLQLLALRLSCQAHSLHNELSRQTDSKPVTTQTLSDVASVMMAVKPLVRWLDRPPFSGQLEYNDKKIELMKLALEMATCAQRDRFAEKPIEEIRTTCGQLAKLADYIIQDIADPMILQPASLDLATLKKKPGDDLGFYILPSFHGAHQIAEIKFGSAAHQCGKMEEGDEIVQVNYQTVVGWERKNLLELFRESPAEVLLTLKRRPRHTKVYGQIYIKPYRLPSNKKTSYTTRWQHNLPSPRPELLTIPDFTMPLPRHMPKNPSPEPASILDTVNILDTMIIDSSDSDSEAEPPLSIRLYSTKPRNLVQRRATITGASPTTKHGIDIEQFWKELKQEHNTSFQLRDKAASCAHGLDNVPSNLRPQTCLGIEQSKRRKRVDNHADDKKVQFQEKSVDSESSQIDSTINTIHESKEESNTMQNCGDTLTVSSVNHSSQTSSQATANVTSSNNLSDISVPLDECNNFIRDRSNCNKSTISSKETNIHSIKERGKLDKSYSTPAYDLTDTDDIEDRRQMILEHSFATLETSSYVTQNASTISTKTDVQATLESSEDQTKPKNASEQKEGTRISSCGNVAQKINNIERHIRQNDNEEQIVRVTQQSDSRKNSVHNRITETDYRGGIESSQSNNESNVSDVNKCKRRSTDNTELGNAAKAPNCPSMTNNSSVHYGTREDFTDNESGNEPALNSFAKVSQTVDPFLADNAKQIERKFSGLCLKEKSQLSEQARSNCNANSIGNDIQNTTKHIPQLQINSKVQSSDTKTMDPNNQGATAQSCRYVELTKVETAKRLDTKPHLTPPEPPPRKYYGKSTASTSGVSNASKSFEIPERSHVPERSSARRVSKKSEFFTESNRHNSEHHERHDCFDIYSNFVEKPIDLMGETRSVKSEYRSTMGLDSLSYTECSDRELRGEKSVCDKYDSCTEKLACQNQSVAEYYKSESYSRNVDSPDGSYSSKHSQLGIDAKPKVSEKDKSSDKGVVNKAMMVARSIGLHGSLGKSSNNSPRSSRKRSMLFARKRNVSVKDLGAGDFEGWLTYRTRGAGGAWAKAWFVLKCSFLYRFKAQDSGKADCLIALTGFTVSRAAEVKSRKYAFKVYHTGTVFYFAADTEDSLALWLDAINKATLGADTHNRSSALFSETDESDSEHKSKVKNSPSQEFKHSTEKSFGSLKKVVRKDSGYKDHDIAGASLDRKYLRFLGARNQNLPVPTAQFRSYRRVLPTSTPNKKQDSIPNSPDLQMTIAGSTFYGLCASQSATDMSSSSSQDMGDYRRTTDRCLSSRSRRPDDLQGFITLEEFMLSQQDEDRRHVTRNRSVSPRMTPLTSDHVHVQHRNFHEGGATGEQTRHVNEATFGNDTFYPRNRNSDDLENSDAAYGYSRNVDNLHAPRQLPKDFNLDRNEKGESSKSVTHKKTGDSSVIHKRKTADSLNCQPGKACETAHWKTPMNDQKQSSLCHSKSDIIQGSNRHALSQCEHNARASAQRVQSSNNPEMSKMYDYLSSKHVGNVMEDFKSVPKRLNRNDGYSGSSSDLTAHASNETLQRAKKDVTVTRKGSFNLTTRRERISADRNWLDSLRRSDKKNTNCDKNRLKNVAQYQPPPIPTSPFEQEGMRAAFEMHLDKSEQVQKANRLKSLFGAKCQQKPCTLDLPKDVQKTLLGSPRLHRALFRDKCSSQSQPRLSNRSNSQSPGDSGISQSISSFSGNSSQTYSQSFSSVSSVSDWSPDTPSPCTLSATTCATGHPSCQKGFTGHGRNSLTPPTLPYIPPPTSPPPDYPGLEYPPVFEPGTYSLSDASLLRSRNKGNQNTNQ